VRYPAYLLERDPMTRIIVGSYNQSLAESFSHETRRIVTERGVALDPKRQMVDEWLTAAGGGLKAVGVGGGITGRGGNCFVGETPVLTERGYLPIAVLAEMTERPRVLAMDTETMTAEWRPVVATAERKARQLAIIEYRIHGSGQELRCTPEHRLFTRRGWTEAARLRPDDWLRTRDGWVKLTGLGIASAAVPVPVYDIQVEGLNNFFAGDVLAHNCILIDDPVRSAADARSVAYRERVWNWWQSDLTTRLEPHPRTNEPASVILIMTRWDQDDLAGRILTGDGGTEWDVLRIPALAETQAERDEYNAGIGRPPGEPDPLGREPGQAMNPERFDADELKAKETEMGILPFLALYQQRPSAPGGDMFRREWLEIVAALPAGAERSAVRYWDKAGTAGGSGAYSVGVLMVRVDGTFYVDHVIMGRWGSAEREQIIRQTASSDFARFGYDVETVVEQEPGSGGKESAENTIRSLAGYRAAADRVTGDKVLRAEPFAAQASVGRVKLLQGEWNRDYLDILTAFPGGAIKDAVDASSGAFARLQRAEEKRPKASKPRVVKARDIFSE
jgi:predicted phage terminase large subunit-like protein